MHSGEGSNADSGHGHSEEDETERARQLLAGCATGASSSSRSYRQSLPPPPPPRVALYSRVYQPYQSSSQAGTSLLPRNHPPPPCVYSPLACGTPLKSFAPQTQKSESGLKKFFAQTDGRQKSHEGLLCAGFSECQTLSHSPCKPLCQSGSSEATTVDSSSKETHPATVWKNGNDGFVV